MSPSDVLTASEREWETLQFIFSTEKRPGQNWSLIAAGDWAPFDGHRQTLQAGVEALYTDLLPVLRSSDLAIVNLEGVLGDRKLEPVVKDGISIRFPSETLSGLAKVPFHLACLANNHTFDYGEAGFCQTRDLLVQQHVRVIGAGSTLAEATASHEFKIGGVRLAVVNAAEGEEGRSHGGPGVAPLELPTLINQLHELRSQVDVLLVIVHAGREHLPIPAPYIQKTYRALVEAGADLVVGHHPHVPQGIEIYEGAPIIYSLGNFAMWDAAGSDYHRLGYLVKVNYQGNQLDRLEIHPYRIMPDRLSLLKGPERSQFAAELRALSEFTEDSENIETLWQAYADRWLEKKGLAELSDSLAGFSGGKNALRSLLLTWLDRFPSPSLSHRLVRRSLWKGLAWLDKRQKKESPTEERGFANRQAAAVLRNRFDTLAHRELYLTGLQRVMEGNAGQAPAWAYEQIDAWKALE